ncbi:amidohydrolase family protein [Rhizobium laguerreae]
MATDHAPHRPAEKSAVYGSFTDIPGGMPGLQTLLSVMLDLVARKAIGLSDLVRICAYNPAHRFGLGRSKGSIAVGSDADILVCRNSVDRLSSPIPSGPPVPPIHHFTAGARPAG